MSQEVLESTLPHFVCSYLTVPVEYSKQCTDVYSLYREKDEHRTDKGPHTGSGRISSSIKLQERM